MSFKSFIKDMRGELGSISGIDGWANLPPDLLRDVLIRIDTSEGTWPPRKNVVACAVVCRNWREVMKEIVKSPEVSGKLTFPISLKQPGPRDSLLRCFIKGTRKGQKYHLCLRLNQDSTDNGKFLLAAQKCRHPSHTDYIISLNSNDVSKGSSTYVGKLRSSFLHTKFTIFDAQPPHAGVKVTKCRSTRLINRKVTPKVPPGNYSIGHISYELNVLGFRCPRRMHCVLDAIPNSAVEPGGVAPTLTEFLLGSVDSFPSLPFFRSKSMRTDSFQSGHSSVPSEGMLVLRNKASRWHDLLRSWYLNFKGVAGPEHDNFILLKTREQLQSRTLNLQLKGRGETIASVKNFQLVASPDNGVAGPEHENVILQFEKVGKDVFAMDYQYPISAFQAFAICLSSFDTRIGCLYE